jgi:hypothetical protein
MAWFLHSFKSKRHKKTAGVSGGFWEIRTFYLVTFLELSTASGA